MLVLLVSLGSLRRVMIVTLEINKLISIAASDLASSTVQCFLTDIDMSRRTEESMRRNSWLYTLFLNVAPISNRYVKIPSTYPRISICIRPESANGQTTGFGRVCSKPQVDRIGSRSFSANQTSGFIHAPESRVFRVLLFAPTNINNLIDLIPSSAGRRRFSSIAIEAF